MSKVLGIEKITLLEKDKTFPWIFQDANYGLFVLLSKDGKNMFFRDSIDFLTVECLNSAFNNFNNFIKKETISWNKHPK